MDAVFRYDFNSPYAYLAASRVDEILGEATRWQPIAFVFVLIARERTPWSMTEPERAQGVEECELRALEYGLPPLSWPPGWPKGSYTLDPLRAALFAQEHGALREYSAAAFARNFVSGAGLLGDASIEIAEEVGLDPDATRAAIAGPMRERLKHATEEAIAAGIGGVPTVTVAGKHFWGDDQLDAAATALRAAR